MGKAMLVAGIFLMALWPMDKAMLEQVHLKVTVAVDKSMLQQTFL